MNAKVKSMFADWSNTLQIKQLKGDLNKIADDIGKVKEKEKKGVNFNKLFYQPTQPTQPK